MELRQTLIPSYYEDFKCIADKCEDTCCAGWQIPIDKKTFKEYKKLQHSSEKNREFFSSNFYKNTNGANSQSYGLMRLDSEGRCNFLNNENLCQIVLKHGPDKLCTTCKVFPRNYSFYQSSNYQELALTTACPEATRKIVNLNSRITFSLENASKLNVLSFVQNNQSTGKDLYGFEIRFAIIGILQSDIYKIEEKKIIIGLLIKKIMDEENIHCIPEILNSFNTVLDNRIILRDNLEKSKFSYDLLSFIAKTKQSSNKTYNQLINNCLEKTLKNYEFYLERITCFREIEDEINKILPFSLENYLVNYVYKNNFPFKGADLLDELYIFNLQFSIIKCMIVSEIEKNEKLSPNDLGVILTKIIYSTGRVLEHNTQYFKSILDELKRQNKYTLVHALLLS